MRRVLFTAFCCLSGAVALLQAQNIRVNQIGYYATAQKIAVVPSTESGSFTLVDNKTKQTAYTGTLPTTVKTWTPSQESIKIADFSAFSLEGEYYVKTTNQTSPVFEIKNGRVYDPLLQWTSKAFYMWRASTSIDSVYAQFKTDNYKRAAGHADTIVRIHSSATTVQRPAGTIVSAPRGWYDAGDYNLYVVNAGYAVFFLAHALEAFPTHFKHFNLNIPESDNTVPDLLDELKWEYDWLLAMQDLDGGVYFKLTAKSFDAFEMPAADTMSRYMVGKSTTSALDFAAMTAIGYRIFKNYPNEFPGLADKCLAAAEKAWTWAKANPSITFNNPSGVATGGYGDTKYGDEFFWAAAELLISTKKQVYSDALDFNLTFSVPDWSYVCTLGLMSLQLHKAELPSFVATNTITSKYTALMNELYTQYSQSAYSVPMSNFVWGSNGDMATRGALLNDAYRNLQDSKYLNASLECVNYLMGRNATGYSFITGFGDKPPMNIHDRRSGADGIVNPIPGYLCGGPNRDAPSDCGSSKYPSTAVAKSYLDAQCSYSTNEIAINWQAPLILLLATTEYFNNAIPVEQNISLTEGWNLISTNLNPRDSSIVTLFAGLDVVEIKNDDAFWRKNQTASLSLLPSLVAGKGYLVKMKSAGTLSVYGQPCNATLSVASQTGWQLMGCPFQISTSLNDLFNTNNCQAIKNFEGYWKPEDANSSVLNIEPGKGYYLNK